MKEFKITDRFYKLMPDFYSPISCLHHYLHMARGNAKDYLKGKRVKWKNISMFYALFWLVSGLKGIWGSFQWNSAHFWTVWSNAEN